MKDLQTDYYSIPARNLVPLLENMVFEPGLTGQAKEMLMVWDYRLDTSSVAAGIYVEWENQIRRYANEKFVPDQIKGVIYLQLYTVLEWIRNPDDRFGLDPLTGRDEFLKEAFITAVNNLEYRFGVEISRWKYGQVDYKHVYIRHPLGRVVNDEWMDKLNAGPAPRGGNSYTPGSTGGGLNQTGGASFRIIVDTDDWDSAVGTNTPGQSGDPESPYYKNLFDSWAKDEFFPVYYSRKKIESVVAEKQILKPGK
jgi:penicillin amidase